MIKNSLFAFILLLITFNLRAEGYRISVDWAGLPDSVIYLGQYFDGKIFVKDTLRLNAFSKGVFSGKEKLNEGLHVLYLNDKNYFDFLIGSDQDFSITTVFPTPYSNLKITGSEESALFFQYQLFLKEKSEEKAELMKNLQQAEEETKNNLREKIRAVDQQMTRFIDTERKKIPGSMYNVFLNGIYQPITPNPPAPVTHPKFDSIAWFHNYFFQRDHFLDGIDFTDDRILNTPLLRPKLETYFNKILLQAADSIIPYAQRVIRQSEPDHIMFQYVSQFILNNALQSNIMGMDAVFVAVADSVYLNGKATWADSTTLAKIAEEAYLSRYNLLGKKAPEMLMTNLDGELESLHQLTANYTVIIFWEPDCGHCKKEIPALYEEVYLKFIDRNIEVFAVFTGSEDEEKEWREFVEENELVGWHHVWDPKHRSKFRFYYNVKTTPMIYLLDKEKKIVAKKIDYSNLIKLISTLLK